PPSALAAVSGVRLRVARVVQPRSRRSRRLHRRRALARTVGLPWRSAVVPRSWRDRGRHRRAGARDARALGSTPVARSGDATASRDLAQLRRAPVNESDLDRLLAVALDAARVGGVVVAEEFAAPRDVREKAPGDWVSDADLRSEAAVRDALLTAVPDIPVLGEEGGGERGVLGWFVDPLDGT